MASLGTLLVALVMLLAGISAGGQPPRAVASAVTPAPPSQAETRAMQRYSRCQSAAVRAAFPEQSTQPPTATELATYDRAVRACARHLPEGAMLAGPGGSAIANATGSPVDVIVG